MPYHFCLGITLKLSLASESLLHETILNKTIDNRRNFFIYVIISSCLLIKATFWEEVRMLGMLQ